METVATMARIILVEDDGLLAAELSDALDDFDVFTVFDLASLDRADVAGQNLVLDLRLPGQNVFAFARRVHLWDAAGVVLMSGHGGSVLAASERLMRELGVPVLACLEKPFDVETLRQILSQHAGATRMRARAPKAFDDAVCLIDELDRQGGRFGFQPKVDLPARRLSGFEVLLMPLEVQGRTIGPAQQIALAKSVPDLHERIVHQAAEAGLGLAEEIERAIGAKVDLSVNIEADLLTNADLFQNVLGLCEAASFPPERLTFELVETWAYGGDIMTSEGIIALRLNGFGIAVDDFGKGQSEILEIVHLPVTELKFDMELVHAMRTEEKARNLLTALVGFCKSSEISAVAEGVETRDDLANVVAAGFDRAQGILFGRKMDREAFLAVAGAPAPEVIS